MLVPDSCQKHYLCIVQILSENYLSLVRKDVLVEELASLPIENLSKLIEKGGCSLEIYDLNGSLLGKETAGIDAFVFQEERQVQIFSWMLLIIYQS